MIAPNTFVRVTYCGKPQFPYGDLGVVTQVNGDIAMVAFPGAYPEPWALWVLEEAENPVGIMPCTLLGPGGFYSRESYWKNLVAKVEKSE